MTDISKSRVEEIANNPYGDEEKHELARRLLAAEKELKRAKGDVEYIQHGYNTLAKLTKEQADRLAEYEKASLEPVAVVPSDERAAFNSWNNENDCPLAGMSVKFAAWRAWLQRATLPSRIAPQPAPDEYHAALTLALQAMEFMGNALNELDAASPEDVERITPAFDAVRSALGSTTKPAPTLDSEAKNGELSSGIPTGWKLVPIEPTEDMIIDGFESEPREAFSSEGDWDEYEAMSGCQQAAHRAKLCWAAMLAAAPQPEGESVEPTIGIDLSGHIRKAIREEVLDVLNEERRCGGALSKW